MSYKQQSPIPISEGGTNATSLTDLDGVVIFNGTRMVTVSPSISGRVLTSNGLLLPPSFQDISSSGAITTINGNSGSIVPVAGAVTISGDGTVISTSGSGSTLSLTSTAARVIHSSVGDATAASNAFTIVGSGTVSTSATGSTLTITGSGGGGGGLTFNNQNSNTVSMAVNNAYLINNGATLVTATLPATAAIGDQVQLIGSSAGGWTVAQNSGQTIHFGSVNTTTGAGGSLTFTNRYDQILLMCSIANTDFVVISSLGNITYV